MADQPLPFPEIIPEPRLLTLCGGAAPRPSGLRLTEAPPEAKQEAARLLARVGAGDYPLTLRLEPDFAIPEAPSWALDEAYALDLFAPGATLRARTPAGLRWGLMTLAQVLEQAPWEGFPAASILDWPSMRTRGIFTENKWGPDLMTPEDWRGVIDYLAERKCNNLGVGIYGCWCVQYDGRITEFLMAPVPGHPELQTPKTIRWFSPAQGKWQEMDYLPRMFEQDFLGEVVAYGQERGVTVIPYVNSLSHNTLVPRLLPALSARDEAGRPLAGGGYCLSNPETLRFVTSWYETLFKRCFAPHGVRTFHIQMDEVYDEFCRCPDCRRRPREEMLQDYAVALVSHLVGAGVETVVMYNDQFTRHMQALDERFFKKLKEAGVYAHLVVDWWWYDNRRLDASIHPALGRGLRSWVKPMTCYFNWSRYQPHHGNIALMLEMGHAEGAEGVASYSVFDRAWGFDFDLLAEYAWNFRGAGPVHRFRQKWAARMGAEVLQALDLLDAAVAEPAWGSLPYYGYTYPRKEGPVIRPYPEEALLNLEGKGERLQAVATAAARAVSLLEGQEGDCARNLLAEAARVEGLASAFAALVAIREAIAGGSPAGCTGADLLSHADRARAALTWAMRLIEQHKPAYLVPSYLRDLSVLYEFLEQLAADLAGAGQGKRPWADVRWHVAVPVAQRGIAGGQADGQIGR